MFSSAATAYWNLYCHVGAVRGNQSPRLCGLGCRVSNAHLLTAAHVYANSDYPIAALTDGLWKCVVVKEWQDLDIALLQKVKLLKKKAEPQEPLYIPAISDKVPGLGTSLGYIGWLKLQDEDGKDSGRTYFGQGHVAFIYEGSQGQLLLAVDGSAVEQGFSGGPVFRANGELVGVLVEALQYAPKIGDTVRQFNALPMISPLSHIATEIRALL